MDYWIEFLMTTALGIISYFLKKTMDKIDRTEREVQRIERDFVTETSHAKDMEGPSMSEGLNDLFKAF